MSNKDIVQQWFDLVAAGDATGAFALFSDDISYTLRGTTPVSGTYRGMDSLVNDFFTPWRKQIDGEIVLNVRDLIGEGDRVVALARGEAKTVFDRAYDNDYVFVFEVRGGKIQSVDEYLDTALVETAAYGKTLVAP